jgi:uncharacterized protein
VDKPDRIFDRDREWSLLSSFVRRRSDHPQFAVVSGRRRQGKTYLLDALARESGGLYFGATEATSAESLRQLGDAVQRRLELPMPPRFGDWDEAVRFVLSATAERGIPVVLDELPYLVRAEPALPSIVQRELDRAAADGSGGLLLVCGSAMAVMGRLLAGTAPLRGRATFELVVRPFDHLTARDYWGAEDPRLALRMHAVVGGTPAYRRFVGDDAPAGPDDFDAWVVRTVLDPATPLFREARYLLGEETDVRDTGLYNSVLAAVANGNGTRGAIASYTGRRAADLGHHLTVLEDAGLLRRAPDAFRSGRSTYRVAEPLLAFYQVVMRPRWAQLEIGRAEQVWRDAAASFRSQVIGPHLEQVCREWALTTDRFGEPVGEVTSGAIADPQGRKRIEVDVVVLAPAEPDRPRRVLSLGEAKWSERLGARHVARLARARELLARRGFDTRDTVLACYSGGGFDDAVLRDDVVLTVGPEDLYAPT